VNDPVSGLRPEGQKGSASIIKEYKWQQIQGVRGIKHWNICKEQRRKLGKGEFAKSFWTVGSGVTHGRYPHTLKDWAMRKWR
jgi:hypothetical protein